MNERHSDASGYSNLQAFLDGAAIAAYDRLGPPEPDPPKTKPDSRIIVSGRGVRRDIARDPEALFSPLAVLQYATPPK